MAPAGAITGSTRKRGCALFHHSRAFVGFQLRSIAGWAWLPDDAEGSNLRHHLVVKLNGLPRNQVQTTYVAADCVVFPNRRIRTPKKFRSAVCPKKKLLAVDCFFSIGQHVLIGLCFFIGWKLPPPACPGTTGTLTRILYRHNTTGRAGKNWKEWVSVSILRRGRRLIFIHKVSHGWSTTWF